MNPWKRARLERARADTNRAALDKVTADWQLLCKQPAGRQHPAGNRQGAGGQLRDHEEVA